MLPNPNQELAIQRGILADAGESYVAQIPLSEWIAMPDHPRQGDTRRQSERAHWDQVRRAEGPTRESLRWVVAGDLNGKLFKVQGHARALLWANGKLPPPECVFAIVYRCKTMSELLQLHAAFDIQEAAKTLYDKVCGAYRQHELHLNSKRLKYGMIVDALWLASRGVARSEATGPDGGDNELDIYSAVGLYKEELIKLDSINPQPDIFMTGVVAAALLGLALNPEGLEFFRRLANNEGVKNGNLLDPVEATRAYIESIKKSRNSWVKSQHADLCGKTLNALDLWLRFEESDPLYWSTQLRQALPIETIVRQVIDKKHSTGMAFDVNSA